MLLDIEPKYGSCNETYLGEGEGSAGAPRCCVTPYGKAKLRDLQLVHQKKLRALGLSINEDSLQVVHNFSNRVFSVFETELLSKGLSFCFFPTKLHLNNIRAEFERVYSELKRFLSHKICWF